MFRAAVFSRARRNAHAVNAQIVCFFFVLQCTKALSLVRKVSMYSARSLGAYFFCTHCIYEFFHWSQYWMLSKTGEIRRDESCLDYSGTDVILYPCHGSKGNQQWIYNHQVFDFLFRNSFAVFKRSMIFNEHFFIYFQSKQIRHGSSDKCLAITESKQRLLMEECSPSGARQRWSFENYDPSKLWYSAFSSRQFTHNRGSDSEAWWLSDHRYISANDRFARSLETR